jgi:dTDP-glucose 4,6-dehydratase
MTLNAVEGRPLPLYGDGGNVRDWLHVEDHCAALLLVLRQGAPGGRYNVGAEDERTNLEIVDGICAALESIQPAAANPTLAARGVRRYSDLRTFVPDRPGHDRRYAIDATRLTTDLGWHPVHRFAQGLPATVAWYLQHREWCETVLGGKYGRERLGLGESRPTRPERPPAPPPPAHRNCVWLRGSTASFHLLGDRPPLFS